METKIGFTNHDYRICTHHHTILRESFMSERETKVASDVFCPPTTQFEKRVNNHEFIHDERMPWWPERLENLHVCIWHTFSRIWKKCIPNLKIWSPLVSTCCQLCNKYIKYIWTTFTSVRWRTNQLVFCSQVNNRVYYY